ncbi:MAG TPA: hypothetical protein VM165_01010, partial [Planctomycetaceae bacterium]|nr:hypothetical protein [Planctomycetaceae bacterium]
LLEDRVPDEWKLSRRTAGCAFAFGLLFLIFAIKPLWHTDVWGHLSYGRWMVSARQLPVTEPLMPLAIGVPFVDTAWLSQLLSYAVVQSAGVAGLQGLSAGLIVATSLLLFQRTFQRTRSVWFGAGAVLAFLWLDWANLAVTRPQLAGLLCFAILLHRLTSRSPKWWDWLLVPALHCAWANLHGSFVVGLGLLAAHVLCRAVDLVRRTGSLRALWHDQTVRRLLVWLELSAVATLVNPYGLGLIVEVLRFPDNPNLRALTEWQALNPHSPNGYVFLGSVVALMFAYRCSPRRIAAWEPLALFGLAIGTLWSARFLVWWGPVSALLLAMHAHAALRRWSPWRAEPAVSPRSGKWSVVTLGLVWIFFAYSPIGLRLLHKTEPKLTAAVSPETPLSATKWLNEHPPVGQVFNTYEWGDYLQWAGPPGMPIFVNSHAHLVPREVWQHYLNVVDVTVEWEDVLDRYGVNTVVLDTQYRDALIRRLKDHAKWTLRYEDKQAAIFVRKSTI